MGDPQRYLHGLRGSWEGLAAPHPGAVVVSEPAFLAARFPHPVLNNAVLLDPDALPRLRAFYAGEPTYAIWTELTDQPASAALEAAGFHRDVTTRPMVCHLDQIEPAPDELAVRTADPAHVAAISGVPADLLHGVPGLRSYTTSDGQSALVVQDVDDAVVVSFVATVPAARGRGLASRLTRQALRDGKDHGAAVAVLQATPMAERIYQRLGFEPVGHWQEWVP